MAGARSMGRAGAAMVSDDSGTALLLNPGGLVRRTGLRVQLGLGIHDHDLGYRAVGTPGQPDQVPLIEDHGPPTTTPLLAGQGSLGPLVVGLTFVDADTWSRALPEVPLERRLDYAELERLSAQLPHRYGGTRVSYRQQLLCAGAAVRAGSWLGLGASLSVGRVELTERRHVWAEMQDVGFLGDMAKDVVVSVSGRDAFVPGMSAGALIAPPELPLELAVSATYVMPAQVRGSATATAISVNEYPAVTLDRPASEARLPGSLTARAGARYLGERVLLEAGGQITTYSGDPASWQITGVRISNFSGAVAELSAMPSLVERRTHGAVRASVDVELVAGFLWVSGGYAYRTAASKTRRMSPGHADLGGHTVGLGAEAQWSGTSVTIGYSRTRAHRTTVTETELSWITPFDAPAQPVALGDYAGSHDSFGVALEIAWE